jgi:hypothetical protein
MKMVVVDEVSMLSAQFLVLLDTRLRSMYNSDQTFGGISILLIDDFNQKQHYVPYYLSIVFFISQICFRDHKYVFTLVRCSIILSRLFLTYLHPCSLPYVQIYQIFVRLLMSHEKCPIWQVLFVLKFGTFNFFFVLYCTLFKFIMVYSKCPKCHTHFFPFCLILLVSTI